MLPCAGDLGGHEESRFHFLNVEQLGWIGVESNGDVLDGVETVGAKLETGHCTNGSIGKSKIRNYYYSDRTAF